MALVNKETGKDSTVSDIAKANQRNGKIVRERRVYDHEMTDKERYALQVVLKAKAACAQLAIAIQEGKQVNPTAIKSCIELQLNATEMLFG